MVGELIKTLKKSLRTLAQACGRLGMLTQAAQLLTVGTKCHHIEKASKNPHFRIFNLLMTRFISDYFLLENLWCVSRGEPFT